jgi:hypothetical protein
MSVSSTRKNFSASMALISLANLSPSRIESNCWKSNHLPQAAATKFARQSIANGAAIFARFYLVGTKARSGGASAAFRASDIALLEAMMGRKADLGAIKPKGAPRNYVIISIT